MKKYSIAILMVLFLASCGPKGGESMGQHVCECVKKANQMSDKNRNSAMNNCVQLMMEYEEELKGNPKEEKAYNDNFPCVDTLFL